MRDLREPKTCLRCGGTNLEPGAVESTGRIYFRPENSRFMTLSTANVPLKANICVDCGTIEFIGDVGKTRKLTRRSEAH